MLGGALEREPSGAKTSSTFTNNAPTPSARAPIQSSRARRPQGGSEDARQSPAQPCPAGARPVRPLAAAAAAEPCSPRGRRLPLPGRGLARTPLPPRWGTMARLAAPWHSRLLARILGGTWCLLYVAGQVRRSARLASPHPQDFSSSRLERREL